MRCVVWYLRLVLSRNETNYIAHSGCRTPRHSHIVSIPQPTGFNCQPQRVFFFPAGFLLTAGKRKKATRITCSKFKRQELSPPTLVCLPKAPASDRGILRRLRLLRMTALSNQRPDEGKAGCRRRGRKKAVRFFRLPRHWRADSEAGPGMAWRQGGIRPYAVGERTVRSMRQRAKKKNREKALAFGLVESSIAEFANCGVQQAGYDPSRGLVII
jgi:hypothetical protein